MRLGGNCVGRGRGDLVTIGQSYRGSFAPSGLDHCFHFLPTPCGVGSTLSPLRSCPHISTDWTAGGGWPCISTGCTGGGGFPHIGYNALLSRWLLLCGCQTLTAEAAVATWVPFDRQKLPNAVGAHAWGQFMCCNRSNQNFYGICSYQTAAPR